MEKKPINILVIEEEKPVFQKDIQEEMDYINSSDFKLGEFIYMGMGESNGHKICLSVAYKIDYCIKKAKQHVDYSIGPVFTHISKVKVGDLKHCGKFVLEKPYKGI